MAIEEARKLAEDYNKDSGLELGDAMDDGEFFIFGYLEEVDISPIGVNKKTGEVIEYFPPDHMPQILKAVNVTE